MGLKVIEAWRKSFLRHLAKPGVSLESAARMTNVGMDKVYTTRNRDPEFAQQIEDIQNA